MVSAFPYLHSKCKLKLKSRRRACVNRIKQVRQDVCAELGTHSESLGTEFDNDILCKHLLH